MFETKLRSTLRHAFAVAYAKQKAHRGKNTSVIHAVVIRNGTMLWETLSQIQASPSRWTLTPNPETLELQKTDSF